MKRRSARHPERQVRRDFMLENKLASQLQGTRRSNDAHQIEASRRKTARHDAVDFAAGKMVDKDKN